MKYEIAFVHGQGRTENFVYHLNYLLLQSEVVVHPTEIHKHTQEKKQLLILGGKIILLA